jgi:hypothetical protein
MLVVMVRHSWCPTIAGMSAGGADWLDEAEKVQFYGGRLISEPFFTQRYVIFSIIYEALRYRSGDSIAHEGSVECKSGIVGVAACPVPLILAELA